jgi:hypothetical protein
MHEVPKEIEQLDTPASTLPSEDRYQKVAFWMAVILCGAALGVAAVVWHRHTGEPWQTDMMKEHYAALVGLPWAGAASFILVTLFRQVAGPIKIKGWGLEIEGAGGPVLLWIACFLAISIALWMVWDLKANLPQT